MNARPPLNALGRKRRKPNDTGGANTPESFCYSSTNHPGTISKPFSNSQGGDARGRQPMNTRAKRIGWYGRKLHCLCDMHIWWNSTGNGVHVPQLASIFPSSNSLPLKARFRGFEMLLSLSTTFAVFESIFGRFLHTPPFN